MLTLLPKLNLRAVEEQCSFSSSLKLSQHNISSAQCWGVPQGKQPVFKAAGGTLFLLHFADCIIDVKCKDHFYISYNEYNPLIKILV